MKTKSILLILYLTTVTLNLQSQQLTDSLTCFNQNQTKVISAMGFTIDRLNDKVKSKDSLMVLDKLDIVDKNSQIQIKTAENRMLIRANDNLNELQKSTQKKLNTAKFVSLLTGTLVIIETVLLIAWK